MIAHIYNCSCTACFAIKISHISGNFIIENWQIGFVYTFIRNGFKSDFEISIFIGYAFAMGNFLWLTVEPRSVPKIPARKLDFTMHAVHYFSICNRASGVGQSVSFYSDRIVDFKGFSNRAEFGFKFWTLVFFDR